MANKNTGLGKGLSALLGDDFSLNPPQAPSALPISQVESCAGQPRKRFDQEKLEELANEFDGVERSFAIQAGREVRIIVRPDLVNDDQMTLLARDIAKKIEANLDYPGQIKVHLIRENRAVEFAK